MVDIKRAKEQSKAITPQQTDLKEHIQSRDFFDQIKNALPKGSLTVQRYISACLTALAVTPKLMQCKVSSVLKAMMESARYGLEPNSPLSEAALVPFGDKVQFLIEYRGLMKLAWNTGMLISLDFDKVCENDEFEYKKSRKGIEFDHVPSLKQERGEAYAYYAVAELKNGGIAFHVMSKDEVVRHAQQFSRSFNQKSSPWQTDFDAMAFKTVIRQLCDKKLPKATTEHGILMSEAAHIEDFPEGEERHIEMANSERDRKLNEIVAEVEEEKTDEDDTTAPDDGLDDNTSVTQSSKLLQFEEEQKLELNLAKEISG